MLGHQPAVVRESVLAGECQLPAVLQIPLNAVGCVVFAEAVDSVSEHARNHYLATALNSHGLSTLLLWDHHEAAPRRSVDDADLHATRLLDVLQWVKASSDAGRLPLGIMASGRATAVALTVAAQMPGLVQAIVARGGRPDQAARHLANVRAPTLMIVGAKDPYVLRLNRAAAKAMSCPTEVTAVVRATHHFEEPGTLDLLAIAASRWFVRYFKQPYQAPAAESPSPQD